MSSSSPLGNGSLVPVPDDGSVQPNTTYHFDYGSGQMTPTRPRGRSSPAVPRAETTIPYVDFRHGSSEQGFQSQIDRVVDRALNDPQQRPSLVLTSPFERVQQPVRSRQSDKSPRPVTAGGMGGRVLLMETTIQKQEEALKAADQRIIALESDVALINLHLRQEVEENAKRQSIAQVLEQRMQVMEQLAANATAPPTPAPAPAPTPAPVAAATAGNTAGPPPTADGWNQFLTSGLNLPPPGLPATATTLNAGVNSAAVPTPSTPGFLEKEWSIDRKVSKELKAFDDRKATSVMSESST